jgi:hypothetical protein
MNEIIFKREVFLNEDSLLCESEWHNLFIDTINQVAISKSPEDVVWNKKDFSRLRKASEATHGLVITYGYNNEKSFKNCLTFPLDAIKLKNYSYNRNSKDIPLYNVTGHHKTVFKLLQHVLVKSKHKLKAVYLHVNYMNKDLKLFLISEISNLIKDTEIVLYPDVNLIMDFKYFISLF